MNVIGAHDKDSVPGVVGWQPDHGRAIVFGQLVQQGTQNRERSRKGCGIIGGFDREC